MICPIEKCTGCGTCLEVCPVDCIMYTSDRDGFWYPQIDETRCIYCNLCRLRCPSNHPVKSEISKSAYAGQAKEEKIRCTSASGGAFATIAVEVINNHGVVFGCGWNDSWQAVHQKVETEEELAILQGSKYVQSQNIGSYTETKRLLKEGRVVLYSGTPCQIAGLLSFLGKIYDNLITIDIVCHGVPSGNMFASCFDFYEKKHNCRIIDYRFRAHTNNRKGCFGSIRQIRKTKVIEKPLLWQCDPYYYYFMNAAIYRESCYHCQYACRNRVSDLTLGDFWGIEDAFPNMKGGDVSLILANTERGQQIIGLCENIDLKKVDVEFACARNGQLNDPVKKPEDIREVFFQQYHQKGWPGVDSNFKRTNRIGKIKAIAAYYLPDWIKTVLRGKRRSS